MKNYHVYTLTNIGYNSTQIAESRIWLVLIYMQLAYCPKHPDRQIDTICFHPRCQSTQQQLLCIECALSDENHQPHPQYIEALHPTSHTFRLLHSIQLEYNSSALLKKTSQFILQVQESILAYLQEWKLTRLAKLDFLSNCLQPSSIFSIINNLQEQGSPLASCCLEVLNLINDLQDSAELKEDAWWGVSEMLKREVKGTLVRSSNVKEIFREMMRSQKYEECLIQENEGRQRIDLIMHSFEEEVDILAKECIRSQPKEVERAQIERDKKQMQESIMLMKSQEQKRNRHKSIIDLMNPSAVESEEKNELTEETGTVVDKEMNQVNFKVLPFINQITAPLTRRRKLLSEPIINLDQSIDLYTTPDKLLKGRVQKNINKHPFEVKLVRLCPEMLIIQEEASQGQVIDYLLQNSEVEFLTIRNPLLAEDNSLGHLLDLCPHIRGIHIQCQHSLTVDFVLKCKVQHFTYAHNYRWINSKDRLRFFPLRDPQQAVEEMPIINKEKGSYSAHNKNQLDLINSKATQVNIFSWRGQQWSISDRTLFKMKMTCSNLRILTFTDIRINRAAKLLSIYKNNGYLHTLVFNNCPGSLHSIVSDFTAINEDSLEHLQLSCLQRNSDWMLTQQSLQKICRLKNIRTLHLVNVTFKKTQNAFNRKNPPNLFKDLQQLEQLTHLNLYGSDPVSTDTISQLSSACYKTLETLNLGQTGISSSTGILISKFVGLRNLNLDWTSIDSAEFKVFMPELKQLERLSIQGLNGEFKRNDYAVSPERRQRFGYIGKNQLELLSNKSLKYVNISRCQQLKSYDWKGFPALKFVITDKQNPVDYAVSETLRSNGVHLIILTHPHNTLLKVESDRKLVSFQIEQNDTDSEQTERKSGSRSPVVSRRSVRLQNAREACQQITNLEKACLGNGSRLTANKRSAVKELKIDISQLRDLLNKKIDDIGSFSAAGK